MTKKINRSNLYGHLICGFGLLLATITISTHAQMREVGISPWGATVEIGSLHLITPESRAHILSRIDGSTVYDLSVEYYVGMPSFQALGDPAYKFWMTHTPNGTVVDDPNGQGREMNERVTYSGSAISMYTLSLIHI